MAFMCCQEILKIITKPVVYPSDKAILEDKLVGLIYREWASQVAQW